MLVPKNAAGNVFSILVFTTLDVSDEDTDDAIALFFDIDTVVEDLLLTTSWVTASPLWKINMHRIQ